MIYEIQSKSDFQVGITLTVRLPDKDMDYKALYTIQNDCPEFLLPFRYRFLDGEVELTYQVGGRSKITYLAGRRTPMEYGNMWFGLLQPLLDCDDWFMRPECFVLLPEYLYCDKVIQAIRFVYIPSVCPCSETSELKSLVMEMAKMNHATDVNLENKVVWAIQDFNIHSFLQLIKESKGTDPAPVLNAASLAPVQSEHVPKVPAQSAYTPTATRPEKPIQSGRDDEIQIQFSPDRKAEKEHKSKGGLFASKKEKPSKAKSGFWGRKKGHQEIVGGAAAQTPQMLSDAPTSMPLQPMDNVEDDVTVVDEPKVGGALFRYVGTDGHPPCIAVSVSLGAVFTIGRFDESVGMPQSDFEFDKKTKAVSRRHAAVERRADGYYIVDLDSSAGTFLNGQKLPPNAPFRMDPGCRVSFGFSGADYMWENSDY